MEQNIESNVVLKNIEQNVDLLITNLKHELSKIIKDEISKWSSFDKEKEQQLKDYLQKQNLKLPWFKHGIKGFLRKLWHGDSPDSPSWGQLQQGRQDSAIPVDTAKDTKTRFADGKPITKEHLSLKDYILIKENLNKMFDYYKNSLINENVVVENININKKINNLLDNFKNQLISNIRHGFSVSAKTPDVTEPEIDVTEPENDVTEPEIDVTEPEEDVTEPEIDVTEPTLDSDSDEYFVEPEATDESDEEIEPEENVLDKVSDAIIVNKNSNKITKREILRKHGFADIFDKDYRTKISNRLEDVIELMKDIGDKIGEDNLWRKEENYEKYLGVKISPRAQTKFEELVSIEEPEKTGVQKIKDEDLDIDEDELTDLLYKK